MTSSLAVLNKVHWCVTTVVSVCCDRFYSTVETVDNTSLVIDAKARCWSRIAIFAYTTCIRRPVRGSCRNIATFSIEKNYNGVATRRWRNFEDTIIRFDRVGLNKRDRQTPRDGIGRAYAWHRAAKTKFICWLIIGFYPHCKLSVTFEHMKCSRPAASVAMPNSYRIVNCGQNKTNHQMINFTHSTQ